MANCFNRSRMHNGVFTLILACLLIFGWVRSESVTDCVFICWTRYDVEVKAHSGQLSVQFDLNAPLEYESKPEFEWRSVRFAERQGLETHREESDSSFRRWRFNFRYQAILVEWVHPGPRMFRILQLTIPFWFIIVLPIALSFWLLLANSSPAKLEIPLEA